MGKHRLTLDLHQLLIKKGYNYLVLKDIKLAAPGDYPHEYLYQAAREIPISSSESITGINDEIILSFLGKRALHINISVDIYDQVTIIE